MGFNRRLLVTGAGGQLGSALESLVDGGVFLDRAALDITDSDQVRSAVEQHLPEVIINGAAFTKVDAAEAQSTLAFAINAGAVENLARQAIRSGAQLVQPSTDYVFSGGKHRPYVETDEPNPSSVYGSSKLAGERAAEASPRFLIVRTSWVFGEGQNFIRSILKAAETREVLQVVDDQIGRPTFAGDLAEGILGLVEAGASGLYHLAGGGEPGTWADLAELALNTAGSASKVERVSTAAFYEGRTDVVAPRPANSVLDCSKAASEGVVLRDWQGAVQEYVRKVTA